MSQVKPVMELLTAYLPMDRLQARARGGQLPEQMQGSALFADISGFTPLTEALARQLGPQRGAEELTRHLNQVYEALIHELHQYAGSVISFSGDAITCWFDGDDGSRALNCALRMQRAMQAFKQVTLPGGEVTSLAMKASVCQGKVRRFIVGDASIQMIDAMAGTLVDQLADGEHHANKGEVVLDQATALRLADQVEILEWRQEHEGDHRFAVAGRLLREMSPCPWPALAEDAIPLEYVRSWLLKPVFERLVQGQGEFLAELRPVAVLFLRFTGLDYDHDPAAASYLDELICHVQHTLDNFGGTLLALTIGDKGSYLYAAFGAPIAHEDDSVRAVKAALELRYSIAGLPYIQTFQIGLAQGRIRAGAYGGNDRRTYGVHGDDVNLSARLMQAAAPGEVLASQHIRLNTGKLFDWNLEYPLTVKGKQKPVLVASLRGEREKSALHLQEMSYAIPMVGRHEQFELINSKLDLALSGKGQVAGITGDAGIGKTRLVAEVIHQANQRHLVGYGSECQSYGVNSGYLVWQAIWQAFFELDHVLDLDSKIHAVKRKLIHIDPMLVPRLPLLGNILNLAIPDNDITAAMDAKLRKELLETMLVDCLRARAATTPMMMVLENCQWIDPLSQDLVEVISRAIQNLPVFLILVYRPPETPRRGQNGLNKLGYFTEITLKEFTPEEAERLVELKLAQLFDQQETLPTEALQHIIKQSEGNPFYIEELLNYLQDRNLAPGEQIDLPSSLHSLILTRIDQRTESQKTTLKLASTVGRLFFAHWLWGAFPQMATPEQVKGDLNELSMLDLTQRDTSEPELAYLFKHIVTQEVAYESLPFSTRAGLHDSLGDFIENAFSSSLDQYIDLLAYHYSLGKTDEKKREYLRKAAEQAEANYANQAAIDYYRRLIPLLQESEQIPVLLSLGQVLLLVGEGNQAAEVYEQALHLAEAIQDNRLLARSQVANGELFRRRGEYQSAATCYQEARRLYDSLSDEGGIGQVLHFSGTLAAQQGDYTKARQFYEESLAIRRKMNDKVNIANLLNNLGILARYQEDYQTAGQLYEESLSIRREVGNLIAISTSLTNLGILLRSQGDYARARSLLEEGLAINRKVGDKWGIGNSLSSLGEVALKQGDLMTARGYLRESLEISLTLGDRRGIAYLLEYFAGLAALQGKAERAIRLVGAAASLRVELGSPLSPAERIKLDELIAPAQAGLSELDQAREWGEGSRLDQAAAVHYALND